MTEEQTKWLDAALDPRRALAVPAYGRLTVQPDWSAPLRALPAHLFYFVTERHMLLEYADKPRQIGPGTLLWIAPNISHALSIPAGEPPFSVIYFRLVLGDQPAEEPPCGHQLLAVEDAWDVEPHMQRIVDERRLDSSERNPVIRASAALLTVLAFRRAAAVERAGRATFTAAQRAAIERRADRDPVARPSPLDLARAADLSEDYFARVFRRTYGCSPRAWLVRRRVRHVADALSRSTASIAEVARQFGYDDLFFFSRQFKDVIGRSPRQFRNEL